ncbi:ATP-dependent helicase [Thalassoroseus pseudoceratinae]|uniref:ATP-dependent helicase n=1 Tax=Thalassoroseus pseudoceratinae TaxID=2713176 RepID=UPI00141FB146|nr:ATP-dependent helicase [Thalassoroseus pseudoceratinae]
MTVSKTPSDALLAELNEAQQQAVRHGDSPLLIVAGAGTGKTTTLAHRVAWQILQGTSPRRILLLTFSRRAAAEMLRRVDDILQAVGKTSRESANVFGGTFHSVALRLLRRYGEVLGLGAEFTILDRGDAEDLMNVVRTDLNLSDGKRRFPLKGTCLAIYSRCVNRSAPLKTVLTEDFPTHLSHEANLGRLFTAYTERKESHVVLDYDDLLVFWLALLENPQGAEVVRGLFDRVHVDEYQDTNVLQSQILKRLVPDGTGLTVVGDDSQSIYSFRAATVRNILDFPEDFPDSSIVTLEQNYRSTQPILDATNRVITESTEWHAKKLWSERTHGVRPQVIRCADEESQSSFVIEQVLNAREEGVRLQDQAVLFRSSYHSAGLELELTRRNVPYRKYGGLKFIESAHVKDLLAYLRLAENPRDIVAGTRVLCLLPGIGNARAGRLMESLRDANGSFAAWREFKAPASTRGQWEPFVKLLDELSSGPLLESSVATQVERVRTFYKPLLEDAHDHAAVRMRDLEQLEILAARYADRASFLAEVTLDPPSSTAELGDPAAPDEDDWLVLSTIHSAKGLEWDSVFVLQAIEGSIPSEMATGSPEQIEEERRLFYVALTRGKNNLFVCHPQRIMGQRNQFFAPSFSRLTPFVSDEVRSTFDEIVYSPEGHTDAAPKPESSQSVRSRLNSLWGEN